MTMQRTLSMIMAFSLSVLMGADKDKPKTPADWITEGNARYESGQFVDALDAYNEAATLDAPKPIVAFNRGLAHYALGEYDKASAEFGNAMLGADRNLEARARFNLGNCAYASALKQQKENPQEAIKSLGRAIDYYADTLDMLPGDKPTAENMQLAQTLIKQLREQQQQQQQKQDQQQNQQQQDQQQQKQPSSQPSEDQKQQQPSSQPSEDQQQQNQQKSDQERQDEQQKQQQQQEGKDQQKQDQQQQQAGQSDASKQDGQQQNAQRQNGEQQGEPREIKMSKEQAQRLLQAVRDKEKARREEKRRLRRVLPAPSGKDW